MKRIKLAIFDIDGTIFRSSLLIELINGLVLAGVFPAAAKKETEKEYLAWLDRRGGYENYISKVIKVYVKYIRGKKLSQVHRAAKEVIRTMKDRTYRFTRALIKRLKKQNYFLMAISGSPTYIVGSYAKAIGFDAYFGSEIEIKNGQFTGRVLNLAPAFEKARVVREYLKENFLQADFKQSIAVGDTETDAQILELAGRPIAFNPNQQLARLARKHGWRVVVERKDVIFDLRTYGFVEHG